MKVKTRYTLYFIIVISLSIIVPSLFTNSKYYSSVDVETDISVAKSIFKLSQLDGEPSTYSLAKGDTITAQYQLSNSENNNVNSMDMRYYLSLVDGNGNPTSLRITVDDYTYTANKGFGAIELAYDGQTVENKTLRINISCPADFSGESNLSYQLKVFAEEISNNNIVLEKTANISINIVENGVLNNSAPVNQIPEDEQPVTPIENSSNQEQENQISEPQEVIQNNESQNEVINNSSENTVSDVSQEQVQTPDENETSSSNETNETSNNEEIQEQNTEENTDLENEI